MSISIDDDSTKKLYNVVDFSIGVGLAIGSTIFIGKTLFFFWSLYFHDYYEVNSWILVDNPFDTSGYLPQAWARFFISYFSFIAHLCCPAHLEINKNYSRVSYYRFLDHVNHVNRTLICSMNSTFWFHLIQISEYHYLDR